MILGFRGLETRMELIRLGVVGLVLSLFIPSVFCQSITGALTGTVMDPAGSAIPRANVTLTNQSTGAAQTSTTNESGVFLFGSVLSPYVFALSYAGLLGSSWVRGIEWGIVVWIFGGVAVMTAMGLGFDEAHFAHPFASFFSSLAGHVVYGAILGGLAGRVLMHLQQEKQRGPARA